MNPSDGADEPTIYPWRANGRLCAAAPDHAMVARALACGWARWEFFTGSTTDGELSFNGLRYSSCLDEFGVPALNGYLRERLAEVDFHVAAARSEVTR